MGEFLIEKEVVTVCQIPFLCPKIQVAKINFFSVKKSQYKLTFCAKNL